LCTTCGWGFFCFVLGRFHYKKPVFLVMFKKMQANVPKNRDDVHETSPKIGSTETCKKHGKNGTQHGQCLSWRACANIPVFGSCYPHVWKLTSPRLPNNISMFFTTSSSLWSSSTFNFFYQNVDVQQNVYGFWRYHKKHGFLIVFTFKGWIKASL
jgi:hypothetical protein